MGGIKNRDAKRTQAKVFSSGGGGGTKGPAVVDKRGTEVQCPHCDKVYKQAGRLQDHLKRQHPQEEECADDDGVASTGSKLAAVNPPRPRPGAVNPLPPKPSPPHPTPCVPAPTPSHPSVRMMDVGSPAGYYTHKSPRLLLHEWTIRERAPRPRFHLAPQQAGVRVRVLLPHASKKELNRIVALAPAEAGVDEPEALQRGAVAALHAVAGERAMESLLPPQYRDLWARLGVAEERRRERSAAAVEAALKRAERTKAQAARASALPGVVMSLEHRALLDEALADWRQGRGRQADGEDSGTLDFSLLDVSSGEPAPGGAAVVEGELEGELLALGFGTHYVRNALASLSAPTLARALDWLCLHVPEGDLPRAFGAGAAGRPITVLHVGEFGDADAGVSPAPTPASVDPYEDYPEAAERENPALRDLLAFGYPPRAAAAALRRSRGHVHRALEILFAALEAGAGGGGKGDGGGSQLEDAGESAAWMEEREALEGIFAEEVSFPSRRWTVFKIACTASQARDPAQPKALPTAKNDVTLELHALGGAAYPDRPPILGVRCDALAPPALLALTESLAARARAAQGSPMLYDLHDALPRDLDRAAAQSLGKRGVVDLVARVSGHRESEPADALALAPTPSPAPLKPRAPRPSSKPHVSSWNAPSSPRSSARESTRLLEESAAFARSPVGTKALASRRALPAGSMRAQVVDLLSRHRVVVVSGATGCGKSTQVPQFILEEAVRRGQGGSTRVVVTQPRRVAALGLAARVASERGERVGDVVGHAVRLDVKAGPRTRLLYCTAGVLLRRLVDDPVASGTTHVVLDEVHERSVEGDLLLLLLRRALVKRKDLRIVLMSATADAQLFASYYERGLGERVGFVDIPGRTFPVRVEFLEEVLQRTGFLVGKKSKWAKGGAPTPGRPPSAQAGAGGPREMDSDLEEDEESGSADESGGKTLASEGRKADSGSDAVAKPAKTHSAFVQAKMGKLKPARRGGSNRGGGQDRRGKDAPSRSAGKPGLSKSSDKQQEARKKSPPPAPCSGGPDLPAPSLPASAAPPPPPFLSAPTLASLSAIDESLVNPELIAALVFHWLSSRAGQGGALLVFVPGVEEVDKVSRQLKAGPRASSLHVLPLHGKLSPASQAAVFQRPPPGQTKVVVATNVAETSITIDDVVCVIDSGRCKEMRFDASSGLSRLEPAWVSRASAAQRAGRAGRVRAGECFRLCSRRTWERLAEHTAPEVSRAPLLGLVMNIKGILGAKADVRGTARELLTPPALDSLDDALSRLTVLGALEPAQGWLTPLGEHLLRLPCDPALGKMLVYGALLGCAGPALTVAAALAQGKPMFVSPAEARAEADAARAALAAPVAASKSDHLALVAAYNAWLAVRDQRGRSAAMAFCQDNFLSRSAVEGVWATRAQFAGALADAGLVPRGYESFGKTSSGRGKLPPPACDAHSHSARVVKAALAAGLYPNLLRAKSAPERFARVLNGSAQVEGDASQLRVFHRTAGRVFLHPSSQLFRCGTFESGWLVFSELVQTSKPYAREVSAVPGYAVLLFCGAPRPEHGSGLVDLDGWAKFKAPPRIAVLVCALREALADLLHARITDPDLDLASSSVLKAVHGLLESDGF